MMNPTISAWIGYMIPIGFLLMAIFMAMRLNKRTTENNEPSETDDWR